MFELLVATGPIYFVPAIFFQFLYEGSAVHGHPSFLGKFTHFLRNRQRLIAHELRNIRECIPIPEVLLCAGLSRSALLFL
jgi:hypothetical protein